MERVFTRSERIGEVTYTLACDYYPKTGRYRWWVEGRNFGDFIVWGPVSGGADTEWWAVKQAENAFGDRKKELI